MSLSRYTTSALDDLFNDINRRSIGYSYFFNRLSSLPEVVSNFPPYNIYTKDNNVFVEMALSGYSRNNLKVYTENGDLIVEASKGDSEKDVKYLHNGLAKRSFKWSRAISDEMKVRTVDFKDGMLSIELERIIPEAYVRRDYL